ncbi:MAG: RluA family pseudouridine synthase [Armatimonadota bacterium]
MEGPFRFLVAPEESGLRLDVFLARRLPEISRTRLKKAILDGDVLVDGRPQPPRHAVESGSEITGTVAAAPPWSVAPEDIPLDIVYEDEHLAVLNKSRGLAVHPGAGRSAGTLVNALAARFGPLPEADSPERPGIVHRLDKDTSGLMVIARTPEAMARLARMVAERRFERRYLALVWGSPRFEKAVVDAAIGRDPSHPERMAVLPSQGPSRAREAVTELTVLERLADTTLLEARLQTGRTHQIRVHCHYAGHEVVGDPVYSRRRKLSRATPGEQAEFERLLERLGGQALHAARLSFAHPFSGELLDLSAPMPQELEAVVSFERRRAGVRTP